MRVRFPPDAPSFTMPRTKKVKPVFAKRTFLNDNPELSGFIIAVVEEFTHNSDGERVSGYPVLDLGDCSNKISLDFSFYTPTQMKRSQKKIELLRSIINDFADAFNKEVERFVESEKTRPKEIRKKSLKKKQ
jgi:hypothetical protein